MTISKTKIYKEKRTALVEKEVRICVLSKGEGEVLIPHYAIMTVFYHLPKTHKGLDPLVGRPIASGIGSLNETSFYSCILPRLGLEAITFYLDRYGGLTCVQKEFILDSLGYFLTHNFLQFDGAFLHQWCGASMGTTFPPFLANLYMGCWERTLIYGEGSPFSPSDKVFWLLQFLF